MILSGTALADEMLALVKNTVEENDIHPCIAVLQVGDDTASAMYVRMKSKVAQSVGIDLKILRFEQSETEELVAEIEKLNERDDVNAILVQLPLPSNIDTDAVIAAIDPKKDVDGFHPKNIGAYTTGMAVHTPVLIQAIEWLLGKTGMSFVGKKAVVVGKSDVFLQPLTFMLALHGLSVDWVKPQDLLTQGISYADVLVVAVGGTPNLITEEMIKPGAVIIDIGINRLEDGKIVGDVDFDNVSHIAGWITPTPGGVGPVTIAAIMWNTLRLTLENIE